MSSNLTFICCDNFFLSSGVWVFVGSVCSAYYSFQGPVSFKYDYNLLAHHGFIKSKVCFVYPMGSTGILLQSEGIGEFSVAAAFCPRTLVFIGIRGCGCCDCHY